MKGSATMSATPNKTTADAAKTEAAKTETPATAAGTPDVKAADSAKTETPTAGTAAASKARKGVQVSATVSQEFYEKWDELHWEKRMSPTDMVREAVQDYAKANGITVPAKA
jgi:hypothetical protein